jgi:hypothetical protein
MGTLHKDLCIFTITSCRILLRIRIVSYKFVDKIETHILCSIPFFRKSCRLWNDVEKYGTARQTTDNNAIRDMHIACWITKAIETHSEYVILLFNCINHNTAQSCPRVTSYVRYIACLILFSFHLCAQSALGLFRV